MQPNSSDPSSGLICVSPVLPAGSELFTGLYSDYWGRDAAIFRSLGRLGPLRTEHDDERLLKGELRGEDFG